MFGAAARVTAEIRPGRSPSPSAGGFGNQRFGSEDAFELVRPVLSLTVRGARSSFVLGTLPPVTAGASMGPSRSQRTSRAAAAAPTRDPRVPSSRADGA